MLRQLWRFHRLVEVSKLTVRWSNLPCIYIVRYILQVLTRSLKCNLIAFVGYQELLFCRPYLCLIWSRRGRNQYWCPSRARPVFYTTINTTSRVAEIRGFTRHSQQLLPSPPGKGEKKIFVPGQTRGGLCDNCDARVSRGSYFVFINFQAELISSINVALTHIRGQRAGTRRNMDYVRIAVLARSAKLTFSWLDFAAWRKITGDNAGDEMQRKRQPAVITINKTCCIASFSVVDLSLLSSAGGTT